MSIQHTIGWQIADKVIGLSYQQKVDMARAINDARSNARNEYQNDLRNLQRQHDEERERLNDILDDLNSTNNDLQDRIRQHQEDMVELRDYYDDQLDKAIKEAELERKQDWERYETELENTINGFNASIDDLREDTQYAIDIVNENIQNLRDDTQHAIDIVNNNIHQLQVDTTQALKKQQEQIDDIIEEVRNDKARAAELRDSLYEACQDQIRIISSKNHKKYAPNDLQTIERSLDGIDALPDISVLGTLNTVFNQLLLLDNKIEQAKLEYENKHQITLKAVEDVLAQMHENRNTISLTDGDGQPVRDEKGQIAKIELDFWTEGEYGQLEKELMERKKEVIDGLSDPHYTVNDLNNALNRTIAIEQRQMELVVDSIKRGNASQIRAQMADLIIEQLGGQFFTVDDRGYENNDARNAYIIKLHNETSKIIVIINPESNTVNHVVIGTVETDLSEPDLIVQGDDINAVLANLDNVETDGGVCHHRDPAVERALRSMYDMDIIKKGIPKETREQARINNIRK